MAFFYSERFMRKNPTFPQSAHEVMVTTSFLKCPDGQPFADGDILWMDILPYSCIHVEHLVSFSSKYSMGSTGTPNPVVDPTDKWDATAVIPDVVPYVFGVPWQTAFAMDSKVDRKWREFQCIGINISGAAGASGYITRLVLRYKNFERFRRNYDVREQPDMSAIQPPPYSP